MNGEVAQHESAVPEAGRRAARFGRRGWMTAAVGATALPTIGLVDGFLLTPSFLETSVHAVGGSGSRLREPGSLRIVQVSDLHIRAFGDFETRVLDMVAALRPDIVVHTGDMLDSQKGLSPLREFLDRCPGVPSFAIPGNWEYASGVPMTEIDSLCRTLGIDWLVNRSVVVEHGPSAIRITGLDDLRMGRPDPDAVRGSASRVPNHLVLAHCPALRDRLGQSSLARADLVLSGHTHGGQVSPLGLPIVLPSGSGRYVAGWYGRGEATGPPPLYVSRGVGTSVIPFRLGSRPELAVFDWQLS